jgi:hypothetical protein
MNLDDLFAAYYVQYRTEADTPNSTDDEYIIFTGLSKEAIYRWSNYDNTFWKELWNTLQISQDGDLVIGDGQTEYATPEDMRIAGGKIRLFDAQGLTQARIPIIEPQDVQFQPDNRVYAYFIGDPNNGFTLNINPEPPTNWVGLNMNYIYYKKPTILVDGTDFTEMSQPYFIVHRALANRFRGSRNPYYTSAKNDAEDVLKTMQMENNSGTWADPWKMADNSSGRFGS